MVRRLFELDEEASYGSTRTHEQVMGEHDYVTAWLEFEYGDKDLSERLSWWCTSGHFSLEDLFRWVDEEWDDLNEFLEGDDRSIIFYAQ